MNIIVLDLDGTISDDRWRRRMINLANQNPFHDYHTAAPYDLLVNHHLFQNIEPGIVICTTRPETYRWITERWLSAQGIHPLAVLMRGTDDMRGTEIVKKELVAQWLAKNPKANIVCCYDDRPDVLRAYQVLGVPTCLVVIQ